MLSTERVKANSNLYIEVPLLTMNHFLLEMYGREMLLGNRADHFPFLKESDCLAVFWKNWLVYGRLSATEMFVNVFFAYFQIVIFG